MQEGGISRACLQVHLKGWEDHALAGEILCDRLDRRKKADM